MQEETSNYDHGPSSAIGLIRPVDDQREEQSANTAATESNAICKGSVVLEVFSEQVQDWGVNDS